MGGRGWVAGVRGELSASIAGGRKVTGDGEDYGCEGESVGWGWWFGVPPSCRPPTFAREVAEVTGSEFEPLDWGVVAGEAKGMVRVEFAGRLRWLVIPTSCRVLAGMDGGFNTNS
ncbi:hypothetical protein TIFTF001_050213 [Ficus carica]|uniref:Uncharacterized protein n=1 Tax=Ficus carica TaxID=3494 RepID=A0AA88CMP8_FICCA|nr:hypothetical protein TIFTF001_050213 [Ficus carica]